jgi:hypothetical protein
MRLPRGTGLDPERFWGTTAEIIAALNAEIRAPDANAPVYNASTIAAQIDRTLAVDRLMALVTGLVGYSQWLSRRSGYTPDGMHSSALTGKIGIRRRSVQLRPRPSWPSRWRVGVPRALWPSRTLGSSDARGAPPA